MKTKSKILLDLLEATKTKEAEEIDKQFREAIEERKRKIKPSIFSAKPVKVK